MMTSRSCSSVQASCCSVMTSRRTDSVPTTYSTGSAPRAAARYSSTFSLQYSQTPTFFLTSSRVGSLSIPSAVLRFNVVSWYICSATFLAEWFGQIVQVGDEDLGRLDERQDGLGALGGLPLVDRRKAR